jgi:uncharacterized protein (DUF1800 family)
MKKTAKRLALMVLTKHIANVSLTLVLALSMVSGIASAFADSKTSGKKLSEDQKIIHTLNRLGYGPRPGDVEKVKKVGLEKYIDQQLHPERIDDKAIEAKLKGLTSLQMDVAELYRNYPAPGMIARNLGLRMPGQNNAPNNQNGPPNSEETKDDQRDQRQQIQAYYRENNLKPPQLMLIELQSQKIIRAAYSERQLQEVMTDFWFNHFNIFWAKGADRWMTTDFEMNTIRPNTLGKFKDIVKATAKSPAMLFYLDNFQSMTPDVQLPGRGRFARRNAGRLPNRQSEQMTDEQRERLNQLRNRKRGINENYARELMELHTLGVDGGYTQKDVQEVARCFTGWTIDRPQINGSFIFREIMHDKGEKVVLGQKIDEGGIKDGEKVIEILSRHPGTAKFISTKLVRRFVSDNPPQSLIDRVASVYQKTDGDIREMLKTIFASQEFYSREAYRAKIKSPFELAISAIRAMSSDVVVPLQTAQFISKMGQPLYLYQAPTGYPDRAEQWVNTGALLERLNFGIALSTNRLRGVNVDMTRVAPDLEPADSKRVMNSALAVLLNGDVSDQTRSILEKQLKDGVSVKGELDQSSKNSAMKNSDEDYVDEMIADAGRGPERNRERGRLARAYRRAGQTVNQPSMSKGDLEIAKVFGLVLGSPEFQRR